jgi:glycosyltransferase involved in cell wall biosynthesis
MDTRRTVRRQDMTIVIVGTAYPLRGGIAHYVALLWKHLSKRHDVRIVTFSRQYPKLLFPGSTQEESGEPGIPVESSQWIDSINPFSWILTGLRIRRMAPDIILFKYWMPFFAPSYGVIAAVARCGRRRRTKTMFICDNIIPHERRPGDRMLTRFAFRFIDGFIVQSQAVARDLALWHPAPVQEYLPHPVYEIFGEELEREEARKSLEQAYPSIRIAPGAKVLLFFGYIRDYKGLDVLLDAMPAILARHNVTLLVAGECYTDSGKYVRQAEQLGITDNVVFHFGYTPNEHVSVFFSAADVLVLPYKTATQSGIIQIAYNFHRPVIATDVGGLGEVIVPGYTGDLTPPLDPQAIAASVCDFYDNARFDSYRENVIKEKQKYSWDNMVEGIERLYSTCMNKEN